ncbi:MAG: efflux RND transporter periplasmic adaptor subunit [Bryobacteraceae bacterium]
MLRNELSNWVRFFKSVWGGGIGFIFAYLGAYKTLGKLLPSALMARLLPILRQTIMPGVVLLCTSACTTKTSGNASAAASAARPPVVVVAPVVQKTVPIYRELIGRTTAIYTVDVRSQATGILEQALFKQGQAVRKGQLLFTIDPSQYEAALQSARATLSKAQADVAQAEATLNKNNQDVARYEPLMKQRAIPKEQYDTAVASMKTAQAQVQQMQAEVKQEQAAVHQAEINLSYTKIQSPINGVAGIRQVDPGNLVNSSTTMPLVTISSSNPMDVQFDISEIDYLRYIQKVRTRTERQKAASDITFQLLLPDGSTYHYQGKFVCRTAL